MSFYNEVGTNSRVPKDSVVFTASKFELEDLHTETTDDNAINTNENELTIKELKKRNDELLERDAEREKVWMQNKEWLEVEKVKIEELRMENEQEKQRLHELDKELSAREDEIEKTARKTILENQESILKYKKESWENAISLVEEILSQKIEEKSIKIEPLIMGMLKKLPTEFSKLEITVNPETYEKLNEEFTSKTNWILSNVEWVFDFNLKFGEFVLKQENEYRVLKFDLLIDDLKEIIKLEERVAVDE